ncbi:restriction endonuclease subunit S [Helicobacter pylori]|uniref:restriction endonuclease subunit S n=1 Tax=Helicobacter pylori TaxID=210 RepID=UPI00046DDDE2|nr:restriction endonuclease subunit S [Helicobacter pylori]
MDAFTTPSNWQRVRLGTYKYRRGSFPQPYGNPQWYSDNDMPFVQVYDVGENFKLTQKTKQKISKIAQPMSVFVPKNSVIITLQGTIGRVALTQYDCYCDRTILIFDNNTLNDVNKYFFVLSLFTKFEEEKRKADGSIIKTITKQTLKDFEILLPPLDEQAAIANILSDVDRYLCSLDALILKKESVKKALSFELLGQRKRLKGFNQAWQRVRLGDIGITISGLVGKTKQDFINGNAKYITFLNVLNNVIIDTSILENVKIYPNEKQNSFKKYDLFFNTSSETPKEVGMCAVLLDGIDQVFLNSFCFGFRIFDKTIDSLFLSYLINSEIGRKAFENLAQGSTRYNLSKSGFNNVCLFLPPLNEQIAIANILSALDSEIISLKNKKRQFDNIKKALNHDLMSAKIRVLKK